MTDREQPNVMWGLKTLPVPPKKAVTANIGIRGVPHVAAECGESR